MAVMQYTKVAMKCDLTSIILDNKDKDKITFCSVAVHSLTENRQVMMYAALFHR